MPQDYYLTPKERSTFKWIWHSVSSHIRSGYGNVTRNLLTRFKSYGYNFTVSCYYGIEPGGVLLLNGIPHLPSKQGSFGMASCIHYTKTLKINASWLFTDPWAFDWFPVHMPNPCSYGPLDHIEYPIEIQNIMHNYSYKVAPSKFQVHEWAKYDPPINFEYIPHGVDTKIFHPVSKEKARQIIGLPKDIFIIGQVAANSDKESRKSYQEIFQAMRIFLDNNPDIKEEHIKYFLYSNPKDPKGIQLELLARRFKLEKLVIFQNPLIFDTGLKDEEMALMYNSFDILINPSRREGFGLPIIEAQACGRPVIGTEFSSMVELISGHGWLAKPKTFLVTPINAITAVPDEHSIARCIERAYFKDKERAKFSKLSRKFALQYDWDLLVRDKWVPYLDKIIIENTPKPLKDRKIL